MKKVLKTITYAEESRSKILLNDATKIRLNPDGWIQLKEVSGSYSTDIGIFVRSWLCRPQSIKQWAGFQEVSNKPDDTLIFHRLSDGVDDYWWNGLEWALATDVELHWNTDIEVHEHISEWASQYLQVISTLYTPDGKSTPQLHEIRLLMNCDINVYEDLVFNSLLPMIGNGIIPTGDVAHTMASAGSQIKLSDLGLEKFNVTDIESVYENGAWPDILLSFAGGIIKLKKPLSIGASATIRFKYKMDVVFSYHQDYTELEKLPALVLDGFESVERLTPQGQEVFGERYEGRATVFPDSRVETLAFTLLSVTELGVDQQRHRQAIEDFFAANGLVRSVGLDEEYSMVRVGNSTTDNRNNLSDYKMNGFPFQVWHVPVLAPEATEGWPILEFTREWKVKQT